MHVPRRLSRNVQVVLMPEMTPLVALLISADCTVAGDADGLVWR
jgi:hypothetical protein